jgi:hypothetical protein
MESQPRIFFSGRYTYRNIGVLIGSVLATAFGANALWYLVQAIPKSTWGLSAFAAGAFVGGIGGFLFVIGLIFAKNWFFDTNRVLEISEEGIRYGKAFRPWSKIRWIGSRAGGGRTYLCYHIWRWDIDRPLLVDRNPTVAEFQKLMRTLRRELSGRYPEITFG